MRLLATLLCLILFSAVHANPGEPENTVTQACLTALEKASDELIKRDFPGLDPRYQRETKKDDLICVGQPMANVGIVVSRHKSRRIFGIFHIHFDMQGKLLTASAVNNPAWQTGGTPEFRASWCTFMRWREQSQKEHGC